MCVCKHVVEADGRVYPLVNSASGDIVVEKYEYSDDEYAQFLAQINDETKDLYMLEDNIRRCTAEYRAVEDLSHTCA